MIRPRRAFTLVEVVASLLVLTLGFTAAIGMVIYGLQLAKVAMGRATALATAMSIAVDPNPMQPPDPLWISTPPPGTSKGYLNGYYVVRTEGPPTILATGLTVADVDVDVYETAKGRPLCSYSQRLVKRSTAP